MCAKLQHRRGAPILRRGPLKRQWLWLVVRDESRAAGSARFPPKLLALSRRPRRLRRAQECENMTMQTLNGNRQPPEIPVGALAKSVHQRLERGIQG